MIKKILIFITIIFISLPTFTHANEEVGDLAKNWFTTFSYKISSKYDINKEILYFEAFSSKLDSLLITKEFNEAQIKLINDLILLSNEYVSKQYLYLNQNENLITIQKSALVNKFKLKSYNKENIFLENWTWYTYNYDSHLYFDVNNDELNQATLDWNNINKYNSIVFIREDWRFWFINNYTKVKLIPDSIIYWIPWKYNFLKELKDDKQELNQDTDNVFNILKTITKDLTKWKTSDEKIQIIYDYVISNIEYTQNFSFEQAEVFSWIHTFANKNWVCEWYVKLFLYMLNFANLNHSEVIRWYVLDAPDFPSVWHAWIKIEDKYYDPTFDDPIWQTNTKTKEQYNYFWLPYDLFYTNRYDFDKIPSFLKEKSLEYREDFISKRISSLLYKYKDSWYNILRLYLIKYENGIDLNKKLDIEDLKKIIPYYEVNNWNIIINWREENISNIKYYLIDDSKVENILEQLDYNFEWYYLFKWKLENWTYEYRLSYNVSFN